MKRKIEVCFNFEWNSHRKGNEIDIKNVQRYGIITDFKSSITHIIYRTEQTLDIKLLKYHQFRYVMRMECFLQINSTKTVKIFVMLLMLGKYTR